ncbi:hypothetical protein CW304_14775 [Bacillus sp. UFRGS-B20]|nr:hypothetical protein CW304_14775 [Bacillus sp. UFRGS-B20]
MPFCCISYLSNALPTITFLSDEKLGTSAHFFKRRKIQSMILQQKDVSRSKISSDVRLSEFARMDAFYPSIILK